MKYGKNIFKLQQLEIFIYLERSINLRTITKLIKFVLKKRVFKLHVQSGPRSVADSVINGLNRLNEKFPPGIDLRSDFKLYWLLSGNIDKFANVTSRFDNSKKILLGPNVEFEKYSTSMKRLIEANALILAPSDWIVPVLTERLNISYDHIKVWAAGIDHEKWNSNRFPRQNTIIYLKSNTTQELSVIKEYLTSINRNCIIMKYGYYTEREFRKNLEISDSAIWLGETESQGIALLESWSMGVPTLVRKRSTYFDPIVKRNFEASAAPYLDSTCGQFSEYDSIQISDMFSFFSTIDQRDPRKFVIENFTNEIAVKKLISIIL